MLLNTNNSSNNNPFYFNSLKNTHINMNGSHRTGEIFLNNKEVKYNQKNTNDNNINNIKNLNNLKKMEDYRIEEYLNDYYNNLYNQLLVDKENKLNINEINYNKASNQSIFSDLALSPIDNIPSPKIIENENNYTYLLHNQNKENNKNKYNIINNPNFPDDLLIEYSNKRRLMELRNKYLSSSSLLFLKKKDENNANNIKSNNENNLKNDFIKDDKDSSINKFKINKLVNNNGELFIKNIQNLKELINNKQILLSSINFNVNSNSNKFNNKESIEDFRNSNNLNISKDFLTLLSSKRDINKSNNNNDNNNTIQLRKNIIEIQNKYNNLENKYNQLLKEKNNNSLKEPKESSLENYLKEENNNLKKINNRFEIVLEFLISYINEINIYFKLKEIEFLKLKQNIKNNNIDDKAKDKYINDISEFLNNCKEKIVKQKSNKTKKSNSVIIDYNTDNLKNKLKIDKTILNYENNNKNKIKKNLSVKHRRNKFMNSSCDSIYSKITKTNKTSQNSLLNIKKNKTINLFKKRNSLKNKDKFWINNKLVSYLKEKK